MRFKEFKPLLESEQPASASQEKDSPQQFVKDVESGAIDPNIAKMGMEYLEKIVAQKLLKKDDKRQDQTTDQPAAQNKPVSNQPQQLQKSQPVQTQRPIPGQAPADTNTTQVANEEIEYSKENEAQLRKLLISQGATLQEVMDGITFIYRKNIVNNCKKLMAAKMYKPEGAELLANLFYELPATFHQRNNLSNVLVKGGVLNLTKFETPGSGSLLDLILPKYRADKATINLFLKLRNRKDFPTQVSSANKGAGEDLITILGHPVLKLSPGDLNIDGKEIEVKAMGARLKGFGGSDVYGNATAYYGQWANLVSQALGDEGQRYLQENGKSLKRYFHFGLDNLKILSESLKISKVPNKKELMVEAFDGLTQVVYPMSTVSMRNRILNVFTPKGFDVENLRKQWFLFSYDYYKLTTADKKTGAKMHAILFINQGDNSYQLVTDSSQISKNWANYQLGTDLFNWTNPTGQAPKITYGKEVREKRRKK
jgi:hypothetical protein